FGPGCVRELERETRFSSASRAAEGDETCRTIGKPALQHCQVVVSTDEWRGRHWQGDVALLLDGCVVRRRPGAFDESGAGRAIQVECRRQRADGVGMWPSSLPTFQRADGMH